MKFFAAATGLAALFNAASAAQDGRTFAVLRFTNTQLTKGRMDPIISPGKASEHVHVVMGGSSFSFSSTGEELVKSNCTNAMIDGDKSNYWFPALYFHDNETNKFESVDVFYVNVYYFFEATNDDIKPFPVGMQMMSGNALERTVPVGGVTSNLDPSQGPVNPISWTCPRLDPSYIPPNWPAGSDGTMGGIVEPNNNGTGIGFPFMNCDGYASPLRADIHFPSCYNPKAGLTDYMNNMAWPTAADDGKQDCPEGYIHTPHIFFEVYWNTPAFAGRWEQNAGRQPFVMSEGDVTGYSSHGDFMSGWDQDLLQDIIDNCNAGDAGMDKCPGIADRVNSVDCTIPSLVDEQVDGTMDALPGTQVLQGWWYGTADTPGAGATAPASSAPAEKTTADSKPVQTTAAASKPSAKHSSAKAEPTKTAGSTAPKSTGTIDGYEYVGCFKDGSTRTLSGDVMPDLGPVSNTKCVSHCSSLGYGLAGTEYGGQCYCGNALDGSSQIAESDCSMACEGDASQTCGGSWALSVYSKTGKADMENRRRARHLHNHKLGPRIPQL